MSKKFDNRKRNEFDEEFDYGEKLHREKTKKVKRGKNRYYDDFDYNPRKEKSLRKYNTPY